MADVLGDDGFMSRFIRTTLTEAKYLNCIVIKLRPRHCQLLLWD